MTNLRATDSESLIHFPRLTTLQTPNSKSKKPLWREISLLFWRWSRKGVSSVGPYSFISTMSFTSKHVLSSIGSRSSTACFKHVVSRTERRLISLQETSSIPTKYLSTTWPYLTNRKYSWRTWRDRTSKCLKAMNRGRWWSKCSTLACSKSWQSSSWWKIKHRRSGFSLRKELCRSRLRTASDHSSVKD